MSPIHIVGYGPSLLIDISISDAEKAIELIDIRADVNQYSTRYGNSPLLLAVTKGWNHVMSDAKEKKESTQNQQRIIKHLLAKPELDVNAIHIFNGMTALHIACLRGDDPELIKLLIDKGEKKDTTDYLGRTPSDMLELDFASSRKIIQCMCSDDENFTQEFLDISGSEHISDVATLPPKNEFDTRKSNIRATFFPSENKPDTSRKLIIREEPSAVISQGNPQLQDVEDEKGISGELSIALKVSPSAVSLEGSQQNIKNEEIEDEEKQGSHFSYCVLLKMVAGFLLCSGSFIVSIQHLHKMKS